MIKHSLAVLSLSWMIWLAIVPDAQSQTSSISYSTVAEARTALLAKPGAQAQEQQGWLIINDSPEFTLWSFTPLGHEAHPAVIKRIIMQQGDGVFIEMSALCEAKKAPCDRLVDEFVKLNDTIRQNLQRKLQQK